MMDNQNPLSSIVRSFRIVLVLSFIGSGWMCLSNLMLGIFFPTMKAMMEPVLEQMPDEFQLAYEMLFAAPQIYYIICGLLFALSFVGAILMWQLKKNGWHCYTLAQLLILAMPVLFIGKSRLGLGDVMMTLLFVGYYFFTLRNIEKLSEQIQPSEPTDGESDSTTPEK